ncbi:MAG: hypothetical protein RLZZ67_17 [Candidatus Parcubacteria bacterium]|jgi:hypothetical protein
MHHNTIVKSFQLIVATVIAIGGWLFAASFGAEVHGSWGRPLLETVKILAFAPLIGWWITGGDSGKKFAWTAAVATVLAIGFRISVELYEPTEDAIGLLNMPVRFWMILTGMLCSVLTSGLFWHKAMEGIVPNNR